MIEYLHLFATQNDFDQELFDYKEPGVSYTEETKTLNYNLKMLNQPLTFEAKTNMAILRYEGGSDNDAPIEISTDNGNTGVTRTKENATSIESTYYPTDDLATLNIGEKILVRGTNSKGCRFLAMDTGGFNNCGFYVYGNIMSLLDPNNFISLKQVPDNAFEYLFGSDTHSEGFNQGLYAHPDYELLLPATTLGESCYSAMFANCKSLDRAPELPATTLSEYCYADMFTGCISLTKAPDLLAKELVNGCYSGMFNMYTEFSYPGNLTYVKMMATSCPDGNGDNCLGYGFISNVPGSGTFVKNENVNFGQYESSIIPDGGTVETATK